MQTLNNMALRRNDALRTISQNQKQHFNIALHNNLYLVFLPKKTKAYYVQQFTLIILPHHFPNKDIRQRKFICNNLFI